MSEKPDLSSVPRKELLDTFAVVLLALKKEKKDNEERINRLNETLEENKSELLDVIKSIELTPGEKGDKGDKGDIGESGQNGTDGQNGADGKNGLNGRDGVDGKDADEQMILTKAVEQTTIAVKGLIPTIEQIELDLPKLGEPIRDALELLKGEERLDRSAIKGLDDFIKSVQGSGIVGGTFTYLTIADAIATYLPLTGGTLTGNLSLGSNTLTAGNVTIGSLSGVLKATAGVVSGSATTTDLTEGTNLYFTTARARLAVSATAPISYDNSTGVISFDTATTTLTKYVLKTGDTMTGNLNVGVNTFIGHSLRSDATDGVLIEASDGTDVGIFGAANTANSLFYGAVNINGALNGFSTATFAPSSDVNALTLKEFAASPTSSIFQVKNSGGTVKWDFVKTTLDTANATGWNLSFDTSSAVSSSTARTGIYLVLNAGYTGSSKTTALAFENNCLGTGTGYTNDTSNYGYRATSPVAGVGGYARGVTAGVQIALEGIAGGSASSAYGGWLAATRERTGGQAIGVAGLARNTVGTAFAGAFVLGSRASKPVTRATSAALLANNGDQALDIFAAQSNSVDVFLIANTGLVNATAAAVSGGSNAFTIFPGSHTNVTTEKKTLYVRGHTYSITGDITTIRNILFDGPTVDAATTTRTVTNFGSLVVSGPPAATGTAVITNPYAFWVQAGNTRLDGKVVIGGVVAPTALLHLAAGTATANTAPLKFNSGTSLTTAEAGAMEFTTDDLYFTITTGAARKGIILNDGANLTSGRVPFATTNGRLTDDADLTFATDTLTATKIVGTTSIKVGTAAGYISSDGSTGATGTFTTADLKTVTVKDGLVVSII